MKIKNFVNNIFHNMDTVEIPNPYPWKPTTIYASSLPFCPVRYIFDELIEPEQKLSFMRDFYQNIGTGVHEAYQKHLALSGNLFGNWECPGCGSMVENRIGPGHCCNRLMKYSEIKLSYKGKIVGKTDGLIPFEPRRYILFELKVIGKKVLDDMQRPDLGHEMQTHVYRQILKSLGYDVPYTLLVYAVRENHRTRKLFFIKKYFKFAQGMVDDLADACNRIETRNWDGIEQCCVCEHAGDVKYCDYSQFCFGPRPLKKIFNDY